MVSVKKDNKWSDQPLKRIEPCGDAASKSTSDNFLDEDTSKRRDLEGYTTSQNIAKSIKVVVNSRAYTVIEHGVALIHECNASLTLKEEKKNSLLLVACQIHWPIQGSAEKLLSLQGLSIQ